MKPAPSCKLFAGLGSAIEITTFSSFLRLWLAARYAFFPSIFSSFSHSGVYLFPLFLLLGYNGSKVTRFSRRITRPMNWLGRVRCSSHPLSHAASLLLYSFFSRTEGALLHLNSLTHRYPRCRKYQLVQLRASSGFDPALTSL